MKTFDDIFVAFGGPTRVGRALGVRTEHAGSMRNRGAIPPAHWPRLISAAEAQGIEGITHQVLVEMYAARRASTPSQPGEAA